jgi:hypothetical protein
MAGVFSLPRASTSPIHDRVNLRVFFAWSIFFLVGFERGGPGLQELGEKGWPFQDILLELLYIQSHLKDST